MKKKSNLKVIIFYVALIAIIFVAVFAMLGSPSNKEDIKYSDIMNYFAQDRVKEFNVGNDNVITLVVYNGGLYDVNGKLVSEGIDLLETETITYKLRDLTLFKDSFENDGFHRNNNLLHYDFEPLTETPWWVALIPNALLILVLIYQPDLFLCHSV